MDQSIDPVDRHVGEAIRMRRKAIKMSQEELANALGVSFQQVQKYERGANRISASMLYRAAQKLGVPPAFFYDGYESQDEANIAATREVVAARDAMRTMLSAAGGLDVITAFTTDSMARRAMRSVATLALKGPAHGE